MTQAVCLSFKLENLKGVHDLSTDVVKIALYDAAAAIDENTTVYTTTNEITGTGYTAGGEIMPLTATYPQLSGSDAVCRFDRVDWAGPATFTYRKALIYNSSKSNKAIMYIDFGIDRGPYNGSWYIETPLTDPPLIKLT